MRHKFGRKRTAAAQHRERDRQPAPLWGLCGVTPGGTDVARLERSRGQNPCEDRSRSCRCWRFWESCRLPGLLRKAKPTIFTAAGLNIGTARFRLPSSARRCALRSLRLERRPLAAAVRSLIASIGDKNFALIYDEQGQPRRAVVLSAAAEPAERSAAASEPAVSPLGAEDREKLQNELERWSDLKPEDRSRLEERLKNLPQSGERDRLVQLYGRQILAANR